MSLARLTVKSVADILIHPKSNVTAVLKEQKYPSADPQKFRTPYYQRAIAGIRQYYANGNDATVLIHWRNQLLSIKNPTRRANNLRALDVFAASPLAKRKLAPIPNKRYSAVASGVVISLSADMQATQSAQLQIVYFHCRAVPLDPVEADMIANVAHWVLQANGITVSPTQVEIMDLCVGQSLKASAWHASTGKAVTARAQTISQLWSQI